MSEDFQQHPLIAFADKHLDETLQRFEAGSLPIWEAQAEMGRTLLFRALVTA